MGNKGSIYRRYIPKLSEVVPFTPFISKIDTSRAQTISKFSNPTTPVFKRLTPAEKKESTAKGLCFNYDDKFSLGHKCKGKIFRMVADESCFWEVEEESHEEEICEEATEDIVQGDPTEISFHAFEGHINSHTIRLNEYIKCQFVSFLVDTGSTHNFMQVEVASALKLVIHVIVRTFQDLIDL